MTRNNQHRSSAAKEELARAIALKIIKWQSGLATFLNAWINHFSKKQQRWLLAAFCTLFAAGLVLCLLEPYGKTVMTNPDSNYMPIHIGLPSELPKPARSKQQIH
jgi:hypothetical protein